MRSLDRSSRGVVTGMGWHMKQDLAPILFYDNDKPAVRAKRTDPVAAAARSNHALTKAFPQTHQRRLPGAQLHQPARRPGHRRHQPLQPANDMPAFTTITTPTPPQRRCWTSSFLSRWPEIALLPLAGTDKLLLAALVDGRQQWRH